MVILFGIIMIEGIIEAAHAGGERVNGYFGQALEGERKSTIADFRTEADLESEKAILEILAERFPQFNIYSEEAGLMDKSSEYTFVVDPLDGTNNFSLGIPNFTVSIGLLKKDICVAGVIYVPLLDLTYSAEEGKGAFCNGKRIAVNKEYSFENMTVSYTCGYTTPFQFEGELLAKLRALNIKRFLTNWSPAFDYCLLASGKIEAVISNDNELYDYAAGKVIAREAGSVITDFIGEVQNDQTTSKFLLSNTEETQKQLMTILPK
jgi:myo-inositol-1(or 4)-monophosphatase